MILLRCSLVWLMQCTLLPAPELPPCKEWYMQNCITTSAYVVEWSHSQTNTLTSILWYTDSMTVCYNSSSNILTVCSNILTVCCNILTVCCNILQYAAIYCQYAATYWVCSTILTVCSNILSVCCNILTVCSNILTVCCDILTVCSNILTVCCDILSVCCKILTRHGHVVPAREDGFHPHLELSSSERSSLNLGSFLNCSRKASLFRSLSNWPHVHSKSWRKGSRAHTVIHLLPT